MPTLCLHRTEFNYSGGGDDGDGDGGKESNNNKNCRRRRNGGRGTRKLYIRKKRRDFYSAPCAGCQTFTRMWNASMRRHIYKQTNCELKNGHKSRLPTPETTTATDEQVIELCFVRAFARCCSIGIGQCVCMIAVHCCRVAWPIEM